MGLLIRINMNLIANFAIKVLWVRSLREKIEEASETPVIKILVFRRTLVKVDDDMEMR